MLSQPGMLQDLGSRYPLADIAVQKLLDAVLGLLTDVWPGRSLEVQV